MQGPRDVFKQAFQSGVVLEGHVWMDALDDRNLTPHTYNEETSLKVDVIDYSTIDTPALKEHIDICGRPVFPNLGEIQA